jgi:hypothetical protein
MVCQLRDVGYTSRSTVESKIDNAQVVQHVLQLQLKPQHILLNKAYLRPRLRLGLCRPLNKACLRLWPRLIIETILVEKTTPGLRQSDRDLAAEIVEKDGACLRLRLIVGTILVEEVTPGLHHSDRDLAAEIVEKDGAFLCPRLIVEMILAEEVTPGIRQPDRDLAAEIVSEIIFITEAVLRHLYKPDSSIYRYFFCQLS